MSEANTNETCATQNPPARTEQKREPHYRVGTVTTGLSFIFVGAALFISFIYPFDFSKLLIAIPLFLCILGCEILITHFRFPQGRLRYDFWGVFFCFILISATAVVSFLSFYWNTCQNREDFILLESQMESRSYNDIYQKTSEVSPISSLSVNCTLPFAHLSFLQNDKQSIVDEGQYHFNVRFKDVSSDKEFAEKTHQFLALAEFDKYNHFSVDISAHSENTVYRLLIEDKFALKATVEELEQQITSES